jgi:uncharacterized protein (TIGR02145 family)
MKRFHLFAFICVALGCIVSMTGCKDNGTDDGGTITPPPPPPPPPVETYALTFDAPAASTGTLEVTVDGEAVVSGDKFEAGTEVDIKALAAPGYSFDKWETTGVTLSDDSAAETTFEMPEKDVSLAATFEKMFALINGLKWATANVDAPGTFADTPEAIGMLYQWNRPTAWSAADPRFSIPADMEWDITFPEGTLWEKANDPCPEGWRVPTFDELLQLGYEEYVTKEWVTEEPTGVKFTDKTTGDWIFLRGGCGARQGLDLPSGSAKAGDLTNVGTGYGYYWSATMNDKGTQVHIFGFLIPYTLYPVTIEPQMGMNVRCIVDESV